ncbi:MAG: zinc-dependent metalloprotease, partial [Acidobacteria bacterium]|nr:zinc-dependent metalloprotease [Acidobacteriota bacterium]
MGTAAGGERHAQLLDEGLRSLILHEIGHTIGLNHNMRASQAFTIDELFDDEFVTENGLTGSVMDYAPVNLAPPGRDQ